MEDYQSRWGDGSDGPEAIELEGEDAAQFLLRAITSTILSSGQDYDRALQNFFVQIEALGVIIGASDVDEISAYIRRESRFS